MKYYLIVRDERKESDKKITVIPYDEYDTAIRQCDFLKDFDFSSVSVTLVPALDYLDFRKRYPKYDRSC